MTKLASRTTSIISVIVIGLAAFLLGGMPAQAAKPVYDPGVKLHLSCTYESSRYDTKVTGVTLTGRFDNRASKAGMGYEMSLVDAYGQELAGGYTYLKKGKQSGWFTLVGKGSLPSDEQLFLAVRAMHSDFVYYDFTTAGLCGEFAMDSIWNGKLRSTYASTCIMRLSVPSGCAWTKSTLMVKNLDKKRTTKFVVRSQYSGMRGGGDGPSKSVKIKPRASYTFELVRHTAGKCWYVLKKCRKAYDGYFEFGLWTSGGEEIGRLYWTDFTSWPGLGLARTES